MGWEVPAPLRVLAQGRWAGITWAGGELRYDPDLAKKKKKMP